MNKMTVRGLDLFYGNFRALKGVTLGIAEREITALIGPSGCGKSTLLRTLNRMNDLTAECRIVGEVRLNGEDIYREKFEGNVALIVGGEDSGVKRLTKEKCDKILSLPLQGKVNSLNASVALGIAAYEVVRNRLG